MGRKPEVFLCTSWERLTMTLQQRYELASRIELLSREPGAGMPADRVAFPQGIPADDVRAILELLRSDGAAKR
jgi:hypothetical protein